jgi:hypothetical protein
MCFSMGLHEHTYGPAIPRLPMRTHSHIRGGGGGGGGGGLWESSTQSMTQKLNPFEEELGFTLPPPPVTVGRLSQHLHTEDDGQLGAENAAEVSLPFGFKWRVSARGNFTDQGDGASSQLAFQTLSVVPTELFGIPVYPRCAHVPSRAPKCLPRKSP